MRYLEISTILVDPDHSFDGPYLQLSLLAFHYMLDLLEEAPKSVETLAIVFRLQGYSGVDTISQDFNWDRLASLICSFPLIKETQIVLLGWEESFWDEASQCGKFVQAALSSSFATRKKRGAITIMRRQGNYNEHISARYHMPVSCKRQRHS